MAKVVSQVIYDIVEADDYPDLKVRFPNFDLSDYDAIQMLIRKASDSILITKTVTPDGTDVELGTVSFSNTDLTVGDSLAEFKFEVAGEYFTLPRRFPVILRVRRKV